MGANLKPSAEKAMQSGPMKLHAMIVGTGFVPYFLVESIGLSFPMVGLAAIDSSYAYTGATALLCGMLAIFCSMTAYAEYTGQMEGKLFALYHLRLGQALLRRAARVHRLVRLHCCDQGQDRLSAAAGRRFAGWRVRTPTSRDRGVH